MYLLLGNEDKIIMETKEKIVHKNVYEALSAFQGELQPIEKNSEVNFKTKAGELVNFKYSALGDVMKVIYPLLAKHGLAVRHELGEKSVECIVTHETAEQKEVKVSTSFYPQNTVGGHTEEGMLNESKFELRATNELRSGKLAIDTLKAEMKEVGAQITYARRYTLGLVLGLATEEDKDAVLFEQGNKNLANFAFNQTKTALEKAKVGELDTQVAFLEKELALAEALEAGTGKKAPSLGLKAKQYQELLIIAKARKEGKKVPETPEAPAPEEEGTPIDILSDEEVAGIK